MAKIKVKSAFMTRFGRRSDDFAAIALEAVEGVLATADISRVSNVYIASYAAAELSAASDPFRAATTAIQTRFPGLRATYHGVFKTGGVALCTALDHLHRAPDAGDFLVIGSEKMTHLKPNVAAGILGRRESEHDARYGATLPALGALVTSAYLKRYGIPETALHAVAVKNHAHGRLNPNAHFRAEVSEAEVAASPLVADPLRRHHCAPVSDGAAAVLLTTGAGNVAVTGWGRGQDTVLFQERTDITRFVATAQAAETALNMASRTADDVDVVEIHDAFTSFELINAEDMGFFAAGDAWRALLAGELNIGGRLAVNPSGGMKARGHPIGATGLSGTVEICTQLAGRAGPRQQPGARIGMVQSVGGVSRDSYVFVMEASSQ